MKFLRRYLFLLLAAALSVSAGDRKVLLEMFTNAHCYSCVAAYEQFKQFRATSANASRVSYLFYHIIQPGLEDSIYEENKPHSDARNAYYGSHTAAPLLFVDGLFAGGNVKTWQSIIDAACAVPSPFVLSIKGSLSGSTATVEAVVSQTDDVPENDLRLHIVLTESVSSYIGKNGVTPQQYAMRTMAAGPSGETLAMMKGETAVFTRSISLRPNWEREKLWVTVFIQSAAKKTVYQSEMISVTFFPVTSIQRRPHIPEEFALRQNFPNPFNPSTVIEFSLPQAAYATVTLFDLLGNEVSVLVKETLPRGTHRIPFDASRFASGIYFYSLQSGGLSITRKMMLIR